MILFVLLQLALDKSNLIEILSFLLITVTSVLLMLQQLFKFVALLLQFLDLGVLEDLQVEEELFLDIEVIFRAVVALVQVNIGLFKLDVVLNCESMEVENLIDVLIQGN